MHAKTYIPYPRKGSIGGAPYIGPRLGDGPIFAVSVSCLYAKERPGKLLTQPYSKLDCQSRARAAAILHHVSLIAAVFSGRGYNR